MKLAQWRLRYSVPLFVCAISTRAQQPASVAGTGTVTGHITFGDTQRPARFASVSLLLKEDPPKTNTNAKPDEAVAGEPKKMYSVTGHTALDGSFTLQGVWPGDYYVVGKMDGYVLPLPRILDRKAALDTAANMAASFHRHRFCSVERGRRKCI